MASAPKQARSSRSYTTEEVFSILNESDSDPEGMSSDDSSEDSKWVQAHGRYLLTAW
jgi:hypothetical protein